MRQDQAKAFGKAVSRQRHRPGLRRHASSCASSSGSDAVIPRLGASGAIVTKAFADDHGLRVGSALTADHLGRPTGHGAGSPRSPTPEATLTGDVLISQAAFDARFPRPSDLYVFVRTADGTNAATTAGIDRAVAGVHRGRRPHARRLDRLPRQGH